MEFLWSYSNWNLWTFGESAPKVLVWVPCPHETLSMGSLKHACKLQYSSGVFYNFDNEVCICQIKQSFVGPYWSFLDRVSQVPPHQKLWTDPKEIDLDIAPLLFTRHVSRLDSIALTVALQNASEAFFKVTVRSFVKCNRSQCCPAVKDNAQLSRMDLGGSCTRSLASVKFGSPQYCSIPFSILNTSVDFFGDNSAIALQ